MIINSAILKIITLLVCIFIAQSLELKLSNQPSGNLNINEENIMPIIGILTQEVSRSIPQSYTNRNLSSYIAASYVKFVEGAGGRVVPIWIGQPRAYYKDIMRKINGVLLPGGKTNMYQSNGYGDAGRHLYEIAIEMNELGNYMPIWGICLGFELLVYLSANSTELRTKCASSRQSLSLEFKSDYKQSKLFQNANDDIIEMFSQYPIAANFHKYCFTEQTFEQMKLNHIWRVISLNHDWNGLEFISTVEHRKYPFYGVQYHPEKNLYEFAQNRNITHTAISTMTSQYFANFFINEARLNGQSFVNKTEEAAALIYSYKPDYTALLGSPLMQQYLFEHNSSAGASCSYLLAAVLAVMLVLLKSACRP